MSDQTSTNTTTQTTSTRQFDYNVCANRLPCGICRLTNCQCPKSGWGYGIRYTNTESPYINCTDITFNTTEGKVNE